MQMLQLWRTAADEHHRCTKFDVVACRVVTSFGRAIVAWHRSWLRGSAGCRRTSVFVSSSANCCRQLVKGPVSSSLSDSLVRDCQFSHCSLLLDVQSSRSAPERIVHASALVWWSTENDHDASSFLPFVGRVGRPCCDMHCHRLEHVEGVCCALCCAAKLDLHNRPSFRPLPSRTIGWRSTYFAAVNCLPPEAKSGELFLHFRANTCGSFAVAQVQHAENLHRLK